MCNYINYMTTLYIIYKIYNRILNGTSKGGGDVKKISNLGDGRQGSKQEVQGRVKTQCALKSVQRLMDCFTQWVLKASTYPTGNYLHNNPLLNIHQQLMIPGSMRDNCRIL